MAQGTLILGTVLPGMIVAWFLCQTVRRVAPQWGWIDAPTARKNHARPVPLGGGLALWAGVVAPLVVLQLLIWLVPDRFAAQLPDALAQHIPGMRAVSPALALWVGLATLLVLLGLADDRWRLPWTVRLACHFAVATLAVWWGGWKLTLYLPYPLITNLISVIWIVALINAFNMLDNMDGLSSGVAAIVSAALLVILLHGPHPQSPQPQWFLAGLTGLLLGANLGFLYHNANPARLFMGDAGSYFLGFNVAVITLQASYGSYHPGTWHATLAPLCLLAVPFYDMLSVIGIRLRERRSPFQADHCHLSHRLLALGLSRGQAVWTIHLLCATCGLAAVLLHRVDQVGAWLVLILVLCVLGVTAMLESAGARRK